MTEVPAVIPVTSPAVFTVATAVFALVKSPPVDVVDNTVVAPTHRLVLPVNGAGVGGPGFTVINTPLVSVQPSVVI